MTTKPTDDSWERKFYDLCRDIKFHDLIPRVRMKDFIHQTRTQAYTEGVMKALEVLLEPPACEENPSICGDTGCLAGEYARGVEESRVAIKALLP